MSVFIEQLADIPQLGVGLGLRDEFADDLLRHNAHAKPEEQVEWLEIIPENYMGRGGHTTAVLKTVIDAGLPFASHGVNLSLGSVDPFNPAYLDELEALFTLVKPRWFSDHLCFTSVNGQYFNDLMPLPFTNEAIDHCVSKIRALTTRFNRPFLIENASYYATFPTLAQMDEATFLSRITHAADCGLLLDVNNVFVNSRNHGYDPRAFLQALPLERVVEIHMAGHLETDDLIIDTHGEPLRSEVLDLFAWIYPQCPSLKGVLLERDTNIPPLPQLLAELQAIRHATNRMTPAMVEKSVR
jgi:uncharacterized protein